jgi:hypothetical protein
MPPACAGGNRETDEQTNRGTEKINGRNPETELKNGLTLTEKTETG